MREFFLGLLDKAPETPHPALGGGRWSLLRDGMEVVDVATVFNDQPQFRRSRAET